jgi:hypothetical protein
MTTFTINEQNEIVALATAEEAAARPAPSESSPPSRNWRSGPHPGRLSAW